MSPSNKRTPDPAVASPNNREGTTTDKELSFIIAELTVKASDEGIWQSDDLVREMRQEALAALHTTIKKELLDIIGEDEELPVDIEERVYIVPSRNTLRHELREAINHRYGGES